MAGSAPLRLPRASQVKIFPPALSAFSPLAFALPPLLGHAVSFLTSFHFPHARSSFIVFSLIGSSLTVFSRTESGFPFVSLGSLFIQTSLRSLSLEKRRPNTKSRATNLHGSKWISLVHRNSQNSEPMRRWRSGSDFEISVYRKDYKIGATLKRGS